MKKYANIDYTQRPEAYWNDDNALSAVLRNVKGTQRRQMITDYWKAGRLPELEAELLKDTMSTEAREGLGRIHPSFMGGEYLPDYEPTEVEIARIELASTLADVISIRARRDSAGIRYRIVDEHETEFELPFAISRRPLTLKRLIRFIERTGVPDLPDGLAIAYNNMNAESSTWASLRHFTTISSQFYPQLCEHFEHVFDDWVEKEGRTV